MLASIGDSLKIWGEDGKPDALTARTRFQAGSDISYHSVSWNHTNQVVALGGSEPKVHLVQVNNGQLLSSLVLSESRLNHVQVRAVAFSPNSRHLACALGSPIQLWDMKKRQIKAVFTGHTHHVISLAFNPMGDVYSADMSGRIKLWTVKSTSPILELSAVEGRRQLTCMSLSPISPVLAAGFSDGSIRVWESANASGVADTLLRTQQSHADHITAIGCSARNSRLIASTGKDGKLVLIDTGSKTSSDVCAVCETGEVLTAMAFHEDGLHCAVGTIEGNLLLYDWRALRHPVITIPAHSPHPVAGLAYQALRAKDSVSSAASVASIESVSPLPVPSQPLPIATATTNASATAVSSSVTRPVPSLVAGSSSSRLASAEEALPDPRKNVLAQSSPGLRSRPSTPSLARAVEVPKPLEMRPSVIQPVSQSSPKVRHSSETLPSTSVRAAKSESLFDGTALVKPSVTASTAAELSSTALQSVAEQQIAVLNPPTKEEDSFASRYAERLQVQADVGGHKPPTFSVEPLPQEVQEDPSFQQSQLRANVERIANGRSPLTSQAAVSTSRREFEELRHAMQPVSAKELEDALELLKYDIHMEMQEVIKEQVRQFVIAKVIHTNTLISTPAPCLTNACLRRKPRNLSASYRTNLLICSKRIKSCAKRTSGCVAFTDRSPQLTFTSCCIKFSLLPIKPLHLTANTNNKYLQNKMLSGVGA